MIQGLLDQVREYFNAIENPTEQEKCIINQLSGGDFPITSVHRDDLEARNFDVKKITDEQMVELAKRMKNDYLEQLFWDSMSIIAELMGIPKKRGTYCPKCKSEHIRYDASVGKYHCDRCGQMWDEQVYVLVEFSDDASIFEEKGIGFPSWTSEDNGARYVPEYDYIEELEETPEPGKCFRAVRWPESQEYMEKADDSDSHIELIQDESALEKFGSSAYWVPIETEV